MEKKEEPMPVFEQECSYDEENALLICNIKPILFNCRDLATASTSKRLQAGLVWRSAATCRGFPDVTKDDVHKILTWWIKGARIRTIVDLRSRGEKRADPFDMLVERAFPTVQDSRIIGTARRKRFTCNLMNTRMMLEGFLLPSPSDVKKKVLRAFLQPGPTSTGRKHAAMTTFVQEVMNPGGLTRYSILLLIFSQPTLLKIMRICSDPRNHPVLFHCSSGKDRTGLIAALILATCGLSDEEIFDDYEKSQTYLAPCMHLIQIEDRSKGLDPEFDGTPRYVIKRTFKWIRKLWGTIDRYLNYIGFTYAEQKRLSQVMLHGNKELETFKREEQLLLHNFQSPRQQQQRHPLRPGLHTRSQSLPKIDFDHHRLAATSADEQESSDESAHGHRRRTAIPRRTTTATAHARPTLHTLAAAGSTRSDDDEGEGLTGDILPPIGDLSELLGEEGRRQIAELLAAELREEEKEKEKEKEAKPATSSASTAPAPVDGGGGGLLPTTDHQMERERQEQEQRLMDLKARFHLASPAPLTRNNANTTPEEDATDGGGGSAATDTATATTTTTTTSTALATHFPLPSSSLFEGDSSSSEEVLPDMSLSSSASHDIADMVMLRRASLALPSPSLTATPESTPPTSLPASLGPSPLTSPSTMRLSSSFSSLPLSRGPTAATKPTARDV